MNQPVQQQPQDINVIVNNQKQQTMQALSSINDNVSGIISNWAFNLQMSEQVKVKRTEQLNFVLGLINELAQNGLPPLNQLGQEVKDPEVSNKILDANNVLMTAAKGILEKLQQSEKEFQDIMAQQTKTNAPKTEVKAQEA